MKKIITLLFIFSIQLKAIAQTRLNQPEIKDNHKDSITVNKDTINLRGIIYNADGKPAKGIEVGLLQNEFFPVGYKIITKTDATGFFELKGAKPYDTLRIVDLRYVDIPFPNKGSRFIVIYLPQPKVVEINSLSPIEIKAPRKYPKKIPAFRVEVTNDRGFDNMPLGSILYPEFIGGNEKFIKQIKQSIVYPEKAIDNNIEGTVEVAFTIDKDGLITNVKVIKGIGYGCDEQLLKIVKKSPKWRPGIVCGRLAVIQEAISVRFSLADR
jgi:TonB family protein